MPIYEGTSQIQSLMAMKDTLGGDHQAPAARSCQRLGQARWRSVSARDPLERRVARIQALSLSAQQHLVTRTAADKLESLADVPVPSWRDALTRQWDPKRDFALAMLHAERLIRILADEAVAELLLEQAAGAPPAARAARALARPRRAPRPRPPRRDHHHRRARSSRASPPRRRPAAGAAAAE